MGSVNQIGHIIDMPQEMELDMPQEMESALWSDQCCVYRVPKHLRNGNPEAYTPQLISIGPLHHGKQELKRMEEHKKIYFHLFSKRLSLSDQPCRDFFRNYKKFLGVKEEEIRHCYAEKFPQFSKVQFVDMVLLDSVFIMELLLRDFEGYDRKKDYVFTPWLANGIKMDLELLENQLPIFVLVTLFDTLVTDRYKREAKHSDDKTPLSFFDLARRAFNCFDPKSKSENKNAIRSSNLHMNHGKGLHHFTDLVRTFYLPFGLGQQSNNPDLFPANLDSVAVGFEANPDSRNSPLDESSLRNTERTWSGIFMSARESEEAGVYFEANLDAVAVGFEANPDSRNSPLDESSLRNTERTCSGTLMSQTELEEAGVHFEVNLDAVAVGFEANPDSRNSPLDESSLRNTEHTWSGIFMSARESEEAGVHFKANLDAVAVGFEANPDSRNSPLDESSLRNTERTWSRILRSATKLKQAGVHFEKVQGRCLLNIRFVKKPFFSRLQFPQLRVDHRTECLLRNLIALEQCHYPENDYICRYLCLLDCLIDKEQDVDLLVEREVIVHKQRSNQEMADLVHSLCKNVVMFSECYGSLSKELNAYCNNKWNRAYVKIRPLRVYWLRRWIQVSIAVLLFAVLKNH